MNQLVSRALKAYGLTVSTIDDPQKGYRNWSYAATLTSGERVNLIVYKEEPGIIERIKRTNAVGNYASAAGLPTRKTFDERILSLDGTRYAALYNYLPGTTIPWEGYTKHHIKLLGAAMGKLHHVLKSAHGFDKTHSVSAEYQEITKRMHIYFSQSGVKQALGDKLKLTLDPVIHEDFLKILKAAEQLPNQHMLHMDLVRGNVLFDEAVPSNPLTDGPVSLTGILDFEKTAYGHPVFDLARTYAFLLVDCKYKQSGKIHKYFFKSGYVKRGGGAMPHITYREKDLLTELTNLFLLHDFYKFLRHNPYEYLTQNEHFVRTRDILIKRRLVEQL